MSPIVLGKRSKRLGRLLLPFPDMPFARPRPSPRGPPAKGPMHFIVREDCRDYLGPALLQLRETNSVLKRNTLKIHAQSLKFPGGLELEPLPVHLKVLS